MLWTLLSLRQFIVFWWAIKASFWWMITQGNSLCCGMWRASAARREWKMSSTSRADAETWSAGFDLRLTAKQTQERVTALEGKQEKFLLQSGISGMKRLTNWERCFCKRQRNGFVIPSSKDGGLRGPQTPRWPSSICSGALLSDILTVRTGQVFPAAAKEQIMSWD